MSAVLDDSQIGRTVEIVAGGSGLIGKRGTITSVESSGKWVRVRFDVGGDSFSDRFPVVHLRPIGPRMRK